MKNLMLTWALFGSVFIYSQDKSSLNSFLKIEGFIDRIGIGYEIPVEKNLLLDIQGGIGGANVIYPNEFSYKLGKSDGVNYSGIFVKGQLRYYLNRQVRVSKNRSMIHNAGTFIGFQSKYNFNNSSVGAAWLNDLHFGQQLPLGQKFIFRYQIGLGYGNNMTYNVGKVYPAIGVSFAYCL